MIAPRFIPCLGLFGLLSLAPSSSAQEAMTTDDDAKEGRGRVQYQLVRPDEKSPETVKPEENNPFESEAEAKNRNSPGDTEENRVRDKLLGLPIGGRKIGRTGTVELIMLGDIILRPGTRVPSLFPGQQVELKVKAISNQAIELVWLDKEATGLPPKSMIIPIDIDPSIISVMPGSSPDSRNTQKQRFHELKDRNGGPQEQPPSTQSSPPAPKASGAQSPPAALPVEEPTPASRGSSPPPPAASSAAEEVSKAAMRMLFGNPPAPTPPK